MSQEAKEYQGTSLDKSVNFYVQFDEEKGVFIADVYKGADIKTLSVQRNISSKGSNRTKANEILAIFK